MSENFRKSRPKVATEMFSAEAVAAIRQSTKWIFVFLYLNTRTRDKSARRRHDISTGMFVEKLEHIRALSQNSWQSTITRSPRSQASNSFPAVLACLSWSCTS
jgi:hypothetical protein